MPPQEAASATEAATKPFVRRFVLGRGEWWWFQTERLRFCWGAENGVGRLGIDGTGGWPSECSAKRMKVRETSQAFH